jgi:hypothetical protein
VRRYTPCWPVLLPLPHPWGHKTLVILIIEGYVHVVAIQIFKEILNQPGVPAATMSLSKFKRALDPTHLETRPAVLGQLRALQAVGSTAPNSCLCSVDSLLAGLQALRLPRALVDALRPLASMQPPLAAWEAPPPPLPPASPPPAAEDEEVELPAPAPR